MNWKALYNSIARQEKSPVDKITPMEWNAFINLLSMQSNNNTEGVNEAIRLFKSGEKRLNDLLDSLKLEYRDEMLNFIEKNINITLVVEQNKEYMEEFVREQVNKEFIKEIIESDLDTLLEIVDNETNVLVDNDPNVTYTLLQSHDSTLLNPVKNIFLTIPENTKHGFWSGINFVTDENVIGINFINTTNFPLKVLNYYSSQSELYIFPNKVYNLTFYCDGINLYCYYLEVEQ